MTVDLVMAKHRPTLFAIALIDASIISASAVLLATAHALGNVLSLQHSLYRGTGDARGFYLVYCGLIAGAAALVLIPDAPLGLITEAVQTLAGVLLPSATVFLLLLCNDRAVLGPWVNGRWTNLLTGAVISIPVMLSIVLTASVLYPDITGTQILYGLAGGTVLALIATGATLAFRTRATEPPIDRALRPTWRIRPLDQRAPGRMDGATRVWMLVLRGCLLVAVGRGGARRASGTGAVECWGNRVRCAGPGQVGRDRLAGRRCVYGLPVPTNSDDVQRSVFYGQ